MKVNNPKNLEELAEACKEPTKHKEFRTWTANPKKVEIPQNRAEAHRWLLNFKEIKENWLDEVKSERTGSERTGTVYLDHMRAFIAYMDLTPAELISKAFQEQKNEATAEKLAPKTWAEKQTIAFFNKLQEQGRKRVGAKGAYGAVRSFFRYNGIRFKAKAPSAEVETIYKLPSDVELLKAWKMATPEQRFPAAILRSTGMRPEDALVLTWGDLQWQYDAKRAYIEKVSMKEDLRFGVYLTAETSELTRLTMFKRHGENIPKDAKLLPCTYDNLLKRVQQFGKNVGLAMSPKYFRKLFRTRLSTIIGKDAVCKMAAWTLPGVGKHYFLPSPEECLETYLKGENLLTFEPKAVSDKEQQIQNIINFAISQGMTLEEAQKMKVVYREKAMTPEEFAVEIRKRLKLVQPSGGLAFQQQAGTIMADILREALRQLKEEH